MTNISADHKSLEELVVLFQNLAKRTKHAVIINDDYNLCHQIAHTKTLSFSLKNPHADFYAANIKTLPHGTQYDLNGKTFTLNLIGAFNVANALAAIAVCSEFGIAPHAAAEILQNFHGTKRRLEIIGTQHNITIIDDFAHNPDKIKASVSALRQYPGRLIVMFQPHGFGPMRSLGKEIMQEFIAGMNSEDILVMPEIFFVGGTVSKDISSLDLINYAKTSGKKDCYYFPDKMTAADFIIKEAKSGDRIVIMGARDNSLTDLCHNILERL